jgi:hypothetical protein
MSQLLINRIRKNREFSKAVVDKKTGRTYTFHCRRPTDYEASELKSSGIGNDCAIAQRFVVGWEGVIEDDVVGGGGTDPVTFDPTLWREWCADRTDFWAELAGAIAASYKEHVSDIEQAVKNSESGLTNVT